MSIFGSIMDKIFGSDDAKAETTPPPGTPPGSTPSTAPAGAPPSTPGAGQPPVDVEAKLNAMASQHSEKLNWQTSIVDLMKLLGLDSSLSSRKELAKELGYSGDTNDSASMNIWLHEQVMTKLKANRGQVPDDLKT